MMSSKTPERHENNILIFALCRDQYKKKQTLPKIMFLGILGVNVTMMSLTYPNKQVSTFSCLSRIDIIFKDITIP